MNKVLIYVAFLFSLFLFSATAFADVTCQPIYGGGQNCITVGKVAINKTVQNPKTGEFVDNLGINDPKFSPNQTVNFQISITNTGSTVVPQIVVRDIFPKFTSFSSGPGNFDNNTNTLTFIANNLNPNETRNFAIQGKIVDANQIPTDVNCDPINQAILTATDSSQAHDEARFCIQKAQVTTKGGLPILPPAPVTTTPPTGPEMIPLIGLLPAGLSGWFLRRKSGGKK